MQIMETFEQISACLIRSRWFKKYQWRVSSEWKIYFCRAQSRSCKLWVRDHHSLGK